jgi:DNA polymerase
MLKEMGVHVWQPAAAELAAPRAAPEPSSTSAYQAAVKALQPTTQAPTPTLSSVSAPALPVPMEAVAGLDWPALTQTVANCQACKLCTGRRAPVFGADSDAPVPPRADWLVVTEPPDEDEERAGSPLVGATGQLFDNMLKAVGVQRMGAQVSPAHAAYLTHVVKCRPAQVRVPDAQELAICAQYLAREVALVQPKVILALGRFAALSLLRAQHPEAAGTPLGQLRGTVYQFQGVPVIVSYHPSTLLRTPLAKAAAWADLCLARSVIPAA